MCVCMYVHVYVRVYVCMYVLVYVDSQCILDISEVTKRQEITSSIKRNLMMAYEQSN